MAVRVHRANISEQEREIRMENLKKETAGFFRNVEREKHLKESEKRGA